MPGRASSQVQISPLRQGSRRLLENGSSFSSGAEDLELGEPLELGD